VNPGLITDVQHYGSGYYGTGTRCHIFTTVPFPGAGVPAGAPWQSTSFGFIPGNSTGHDYNFNTGGNVMYMTSWYQAIRDLNAYASGGAFFCANSACT
jgi:hypothetical protein